MLFGLWLQDLTVENVANVYELAEAYHALSLRLFNLKQHEQMSILTWVSRAYGIYAACMFTAAL